MSITNNCCQLLSSSVSVREAEDDDNQDIPWELIDPDNWLQESDSFIENQEVLEAKIAEGALDYVAAAISRKVNFTLYKTNTILNDLISCLKISAEA